MAYADDPLNDPNDAVRLLIGDTSTAPDLSDEAIAYFLAEENNSVNRAAARAAESLAAIYAGKAEERRVGPLWLRSFSDKSSKFRALAQTLWLRAAKAGGALPYAGGISVSDKNSRVRDSDRVRPAFRRQIMSYRGGEAQTLSPEEILSPPEPPL